MMPYLTGSAANTGLAIAANTYQSVFDTAPGTTAPLAFITQLQVQIGGQNMFQQNFQYDFEPQELWITSVLSFMKESKEK
jgi:hypothetical protein